jgi:hypothetical protein
MIGVLTRRENLCIETHRRKMMSSHGDKMTIYKPWREASNRSFPVELGGKQL